MRLRVPRESRLAEVVRRALDAYLDHLRGGRQSVAAR